MLNQHKTERKPALRTCLSRTVSVGAVLVSLILTASLHVRGADRGDAPLVPFDEETSSYAKAKDTSPIARLQERIDRGEVKLRHDDRYGYLPALLDALKAALDPQGLMNPGVLARRERG